MAHVYARCESGHYFSGRICPLDKWTSDAAQELAGIAERVEAEGGEASLERLTAEGASADALKLATVFAFGNGFDGFEALSPKDIVYEYNRKSLEELLQSLHDGGARNIRVHTEDNPLPPLERHRRQDG